MVRILMVNPFRNPELAFGKFVRVVTSVYLYRHLSSRHSVPSPEPFPNWTGIAQHICSVPCWLEGLALNSDADLFFERRGRGRSFFAVV
jgi:hypothetical protein